MRRLVITICGDLHAAGSQRKMMLRDERRQSSGLFEEFDSRLKLFAIEKRHAFCIRLFSGSG
jgi:hypothetical protein